ncbi:hypothetical protein DXA10_03355 [Firmicutes bacterium AM55-24TS]|nr:hypothetical protein DXA10_03355 [Firmicutes bacterium AM55-24TS]
MKNNKKQNLFKYIKDMKNNKKQNLFKYIKDTTGLSVSKMLLSFIIEPNRITTLNNVALKKIVIEYAPIFEKHRYMLDGPLS